MKIDAITSSQMSAIDSNCEYLGIKSLQLMENAGASISRCVRKKINSGKVVIFAGKGNNGGDGFVAARHLASYGDYEIYVILIGKGTDIKTEEARHNWNVLKNSSVRLIEVLDSKNFDISLIKKADIIIDGIFGTGVHGKIQEPESTAIDIINNSNVFVISIDVPSGFDPDKGEFEKCVHANLTMTFHKMKKGLILYPQYTGKVEVANIGIPYEAEFFVGRGDIKEFLKRKPNSHKGDAGRVLVIGGGAYFGAPTLCAMGALRTGADIVTIATPKNVSNIISSFSPNLIVRPLLSDRLVEDDIPIISELIKKHDVTVIGMGLGLHDETIKAIEKIIPMCKKAVVDADALSGLLLPVNNDVIITPHFGEMKKLAKVEIPQEKYEFVKNFANKNKLTVLLKGAVDVISDGKEIRANRTGNAGMTVGGTGDVLAGITGTLFAKHDAFSSACASAFINGAAGDIAFSKYGYNLLATDVIDAIPEVMKS